MLAGAEFHLLHTARSIRRAPAIALAVRARAVTMVDEYTYWMVSLPESGSLMSTVSLFRLSILGLSVVHCWRDNKMDSELDRLYPHEEMCQKAHVPLSMFGRRSFVPRPLSDATLILDDGEDDLDSEPSSMVFDSDSYSTRSETDGLDTPSTADLGGFKFYLDEGPVKGPNGPHLFRVNSRDDDEAEALNLSPLSLPKSTPCSVSPAQYATRQLDERKACEWSPNQVAEWMTQVGFEQTVVEKFLVHEICGSVLLDMNIDDLKEIDISTLGKQKRIMSSIRRLRDNCSISAAATPATGSRTSSRGLARAPRPEEARILVKGKKERRSRKGRMDDITPAESVSIVAIEQLLPEPHVCAKGETCAKWQRQQRKIQRIQADFAEEVQSPIEVKSTIGPSVVGSSDVLGPTTTSSITATLLDGISARDPQESVRQFLGFQHMHSPREPPSTPPRHVAKSERTHQNLLGLPRLTIPLAPRRDDSPERTPISALRHLNTPQAESRAALCNDPYHYGGVASPIDVYRLDTPASATDLPITAIPFVADPYHRETSQSVPPEMRYGNSRTFVGEPLHRSASATSFRRRRQPSFVPAIPPVHEAQTPITATATTTTTPRTSRNSEQSLTNHSGWMRKRTTTRLLRHEWQDKYFDLHDGKLETYQSGSRAQHLGTIHVDEYALHAYSSAAGSKLHAAFKKMAIGGSSSAFPSSSSFSAEPKFAFTLTPEKLPTSHTGIGGAGKKGHEKNRSHHFAVGSGSERVEWMRKLMLAKAAKKNDHTTMI